MTEYEELTKLLMDNGCSITKTGIDELVKYMVEFRRVTKAEYATQYQDMQLKVIGTLKDFSVKVSKS